jgi:hypothetical protein
MVFVIKVGFLIFLCPAGIRVFLRFNVNILLKPLGNFTCLDLSIFRTIVSLLGTSTKLALTIYPFFV